MSKPAASEEAEATESTSAQKTDPQPDVKPAESADNSAAVVEVKPPEPKLSSFGLPRLYKCIDISPDKCLLPSDKLEQSPSVSDGMSCELERELRYLGCELIQAASILLKLPQVAAATGQILYQRYFYSKSIVRTNFEVSY